MLQKQTLTAEVGTKGGIKYESRLHTEQVMNKSSALDFLQPLTLFNYEGLGSNLRDAVSIMRKNYKQSHLRKEYMLHLAVAIRILDEGKNASNAELEDLIKKFVGQQTASTKSCPAKLLHAKHQLNQLHQVVLQLASKINGTTAAIQSLQESVDRGMKIVSDADDLRKQELAKCSESQEGALFQLKPPDIVSINFQKAKIMTSNLGGLGPNTGAKEMLFRNVGAVGGQALDLRITNTTPYAANNVKMNRQVAKLGGAINGKAPEPLGFQFQFLRSESGIPAVLKNFYFSFLDLDRHGPRCAEEIELRGFGQYYVTKGTELGISTSVDGYTRFRASTPSTKGDNPKDVNNLTLTQANRAVTFLFTERSKFDVIFRLANSKRGAGNLFFTGSTSLVTRSQGEAHSVGVSEQTCDEEAEREYKLKTSSVRDKMSQEVKELMKRTDELPRLRFQTHDASDAESTLQQHIEVLSKACKALPATISDLKKVRKAIDVLKSCPGLEAPNFEIPEAAGEDD